jgi:hypothetical protein
MSHYLRRPLWRCARYRSASEWLCNVVGNLVKSTDPTGLRQVEDADNPENDTKKSRETAREVQKDIKEEREEKDAAL